MSWTPATSIGLRAAHPSRMRILGEHRESPGLCRSHPGASDPVGKDSPRFAYFFSCRSTPLTPFFTVFAHRLRAERGDARAHSRERKWAHSPQFWCNVSLLDATLVSPPPMCCIKRTCAISKSRRCNTYKKHRGYILQAKSFLSANVSCMFRRAPHLSPLFALFGQRVFHNSSAINEFRTLSKNSRVYGFSSRSGTRHSSLATSFASSTHSRGRPSNRRKLNHAVS